MGRKSLFCGVRLTGLIKLAPSFNFLTGMFSEGMLHLQDRYNGEISEVIYIKSLADDRSSVLL